MDLITQVTLLGGVTDRATITGLRSASEVDRALRNGILVRDARGRYSLPTAPRGVRVAASVVGVLSHRSAAQHWGWAQKSPDGLPEVTVPRTRRVEQRLRALLVPHWADLPPDDVDRGVTTVRRTLVDCMRNLPFDEALSIVDSALREGDVTYAELQLIARGTRGRGRQRILDVAAAATPKAANQLESVARAQALLVPGLRVDPQHAIRLPDGRTVHADLADPRLGIAVEIEGFATHGTSAGFHRDCGRYNAMNGLGWWVVRFSWYMVMFQPAYVQAVLQLVVAVRRAALAQHANVRAVA